MTLTDTRIRNAKAHKLSSNLGKLLDPIWGISNLDDHVLTIDVAKIAQSLSK